MDIQKRRKQSAWSIVKTKAHLEVAVEEAESAGPLTVAKNGAQLAMVVSPDNWDNEPIGNLAEFFGSAMLQEEELIIPPRAGSARDIEW